MLSNNVIKHWSSLLTRAKGKKRFQYTSKNKGRQWVIAFFYRSSGCELWNHPSNLDLLINITSCRALATRSNILGTSHMRAYTLHMRTVAFPIMSVHIRCVSQWVLPESVISSSPHARHRSACSDKCHAAAHFKLSSGCFVQRSGTINRIWRDSGYTAHRPTSCEYSSE